MIDHDIFIIWRISRIMFILEDCSNVSDCVKGSLTETLLGFLLEWLQGRRPDNHGDKNVRSLNILFSADLCRRNEINTQSKLDNSSHFDVIVYKKFDRMTSVSTGVWPVALIISWLLHNCMARQATSTSLAFKLSESFRVTIKFCCHLTAEKFLRFLYTLVHVCYDLLMKSRTQQNQVITNIIFRLVGEVI